jgi:hypothetical protein
MLSSVWVIAPFLGQTPCDCIVEAERPDADACLRQCAERSERRRLAVSGIDAALVLALEHGVRGDQRAILEDAHLAGMALHVQDALSGGVGHAVEIAPDANHALAADAPFDRQHGAVGNGGMRDQRRLLLGEVLIDDPARGRMHPGIGDLSAPGVELGVEIVEVAKAAREPEVLSHVAIGPLDLAFRFGAVRPAGARYGAIVIEQRDERGVVLDHAIGVLADHRRLHPVVEQL